MPSFCQPTPTPRLLLSLLDPVNYFFFWEAEEWLGVRKNLGE